MILNRKLKHPRDVIENYDSYKSTDYYTWLEMELAWTRLYGNMEDWLIWLEARRNKKKREFFRKVDFSKDFQLITCKDSEFLNLYRIMYQVSDERCINNCVLFKNATLESLAKDAKGETKQEEFNIDVCYNTCLINIHGNAVFLGNQEAYLLGQVLINELSDLIYRGIPVLILTESPLMPIINNKDMMREFYVLNVGEGAKGSVPKKVQKKQDGFVVNDREMD